jgi:hypothetical protein
VGAVAVAVAGGLARDEADGLADPALEVGVVEVGAGVQHRDLDPGAVDPGRPRGRRADLRGALGEVGMLTAIQPDLGRAGRRGLRDQRRPRLPGAVLGDPHGPAPDARQRADRAGAGRDGRHGRRRGRGQDQRHAVAVRVVVALLDQRRHIEQPAVDPIGGQVRQRLIRQDVQVLADRLGPDAAVRAMGTGDVDGVLAAAGVGHPHDVAGHQGDRVGAARGRPGGRGDGRRGRSRRRGAGEQEDGDDTGRRRDQRPCGSPSRLEETHAKGLPAAPAVPECS